jgi:S1-C subfamily serine protease
LSRQSRFSITLANGSEKSVILYRISKQLDLALLKLNGYRTPYLQPADSKAVTLGQRVFAIGSPLKLNNSVTSGVISSFRDDYVQTNAEIYPGNSGGPLITEKGDVLGVNTMKVITQKYEGLGFAIPISRVYSEFSDFFPR